MNHGKLTLNKVTVSGLLKITRAAHNNLGKLTLDTSAISISDIMSEAEQLHEEALSGVANPEDLLFSNIIISWDDDLALNELQKIVAQLSGAGSLVVNGMIFSRFIELLNFKNSLFLIHFDYQSVRLAEQWLFFGRSPGYGIPEEMDRLAKQNVTSIPQILSTDHLAVNYITFTWSDDQAIGQLEELIARMTSSI